MNYLYLILSFVFGSLLTLVLLIFQKRHGVLVIEETDDKENWSFVVERPIEDFKRRKRVIFAVKQIREKNSPLYGGTEE